MQEANRSGVLTPEEAATALAEGGIDWEVREGSLHKTVKGRDFAAALDYVNRVGALAEERNHHPDIAISWNTVTLTLVTHSKGGITGADVDLAGQIDALGPPAA